MTEQEWADIKTGDLIVATDVSGHDTFEVGAVIRAVENMTEYRIGEFVLNSDHQNLNRFNLARPACYSKYVPEPAKPILSRLQLIFNEE